MNRVNRMVDTTETISSFQLGTLFFVFLTGSSIVNIPSPLISEANNGAWLSLLLSGSAGILMLAMLLALHRRYPGRDYVAISTMLIGRWATIAIGLALPTPFMFHIGSGISLDVGLFMNSSMMSDTPIYIFTTTILILSALTATAGIEVIARMFMLINSTVILFVLFVVVLSIPDYDIMNVLPVMPNGIRPILLGAYTTFGFPYAELFVFGMLIPYVRADQRKRVPAAMFRAITLNIAILIVVTMCTILVFGPMAGERKYSMFEVARTIEVQEILQRIESIIGMVLIAGSYMKITITLYANHLLIARLFKMKDSKLIIPMLAMVYMLIGISSYESNAVWGEFVNRIHPIWVTFAFVLPLVLLYALSLFRRGRA